MKSNQITSDLVTSKESKVKCGLSTIIQPMHVIELVRKFIVSLLLVHLVQRRVDSFQGGRIEQLLF